MTMRAAAAAGAVASRRVGLGSAVTALVLTLAAAGCVSPAARHSAASEHLGAQTAVRELRPAAVTIPRGRGSMPRPVTLPRVAGGLPRPVTLRTSGGDYGISRRGTIRWLGTARRRAHPAVSHPAGFVWVSWPVGAWATMRRGHLVIVRNRTVLWRSTHSYRVKDAAHMNEVLTGRPGIATEVGPSGPWYMASWHGPEHLVRVAGWPVMWTRSGNLLATLQRRGSRSYGFAVFSPAGVRLATLATRLNVSAWDASYEDLASGTFWFVTGSGDLVRTDGAAAKVVANIRALGLGSVSSVTILSGGLIQLLPGNWRQGQLILYPGGQLFARIPAPKGQPPGFGQLLADPSAQMVAYILYDSSGVASTVFVVRPGSAPVAVYHTARGGGVCGLPPLAWRGSWLLYTPPLSHAVLIDTAPNHRIIGLPSTLPGSNGRTIRVQAVSWR